MITEQDAAAYAAQLVRAGATRSPIDPLTETAPELSPQDAYAIQTQVRETLQSGGAAMVGHKIGLTSLAMQHQLGVDQPDYGFITDSMVHQSGDTIDLDQFIAPRIEPELVFTLVKDLTGPYLTPLDTVDALGVCSPGLEIIDSRIKDWRITLADTIADNASSGAAVLAPLAKPTRDLNLEGIGCVLRKNGIIVATGSSAAVMGNPVRAITWLANTLGSLGMSLSAGDFVLSGSITAAIPLGPGDEITAEFSGLGTVSVRCQSPRPQASTGEK